MSQSQTDWDEEIPYDPEDEYQALLRSLRRKRGFGLYFVECSPQKGSELIASLKTDLSQTKFQVLSLDRSSTTLYDKVADLWQQTPFDVLFIQGLEHALLEYEDTKRLAGWTSKEIYSYSWKGVPRILSHLNQQRERFRDNFECRFVFLVPPFVIKYFIQRAPDFFDWRSGFFRFPDEPEQVAQRLSRFSQFEKDEEHYRKMPADQRNQELLGIQELLKEEHIAPSRQVVLLLKQWLLLFTAKAYEAALISCNQALKINSDVAIFWKLQGRTLFQLGRYEEALTSFSHALLLDPSDTSIRNQKSRTLLKLERYEDSFNSCMYVLEIEPDNHEAIELRDIASKLPKLKNLERFLNLVKELPSRIENLFYGSDNGEIWRQIEAEILKIEKDEEYIELLKNPLVNQDIIRVVSKLRGVVLKSLKQYEKAIISYKKAMILAPDSCDIMYDQACCYALMNDIDNAVDCLSQAIALDPKSREMAKTDSDFDRIRADERFRGAVEG